MSAISEIRAICMEYAMKNGKPPESIFVSKEVYAGFAAEIEGMLYPRRFGVRAPCALMFCGIPLSVKSQGEEMKSKYVKKDKQRRKAVKPKRDAKKVAKARRQARAPIIVYPESNAPHADFNEMRTPEPYIVEEAGVDAPAESE